MADALAAALARTQRLILGMLAVLGLVWFFYVPGRMDPSPITDPNPRRESIDACRLLPSNLAGKQIGGSEALEATRRDIPHYTTESDRIATSMYQVSCTYTRADACIADNPGPNIKTLIVGVVGMRNQVRAADRWQAMLGAARRSDPVLWREDRVAGLPAYAYADATGYAAYRVWDTRFVLTIGAQSCQATVGGDGTAEALVADVRATTAQLKLPAEQFVLH